MGENILNYSSSDCINTVHVKILLHLICRDKYLTDPATHTAFLGRQAKTEDSLCPKNTERPCGLFLPPTEVPTAFS